MPLPSLAATSNKPIPAYIYELPVHLEPQPALVRDWCLGCLPQFANKARCMASGAEYLAKCHEDGKFCIRSNLFSKCSGCIKRKETCEAVPPAFRRAFNILTWLLEYAVKKSAQAGDYATGPWERVHEYAVKLNQGVIDERAARKREIAHWGSEQVARQHRTAEYTHNFERYKHGLGGLGALEPTNFVADSVLESQFTALYDNDVQHPKGCQNRERRWYYFGSEIPTAPLGGGGTVPVTPSKRGDGPWSPGTSALLGA